MHKSTYMIAGTLLVFFNAFLYQNAINSFAEQLIRFA